MANRRLNATITIGGAITGALRSALGTTRDRVNEIGQAVTNLRNRQRELNGVISAQERLGANGSALRVQYANQELGIINRQIEALRRRQAVERSIGETQQAIQDARGRYRTGMFEKAGTALAIGGLMRQPLKAFEELDAAMNNMEVAMTNSTGKLPVQFEAIKRQTVELGNVLPGTTADFVNLASALKEQGMPMEAIAGGALKSAAHLAVVMKMVPEQAGEMVAKLREAFQLGEHEFDRMADYTQRARFGFGLKSEDLLLGAKYYGGKLNTLGMTGADNVRKIYAIQGMAAQQGMDGSTFGTNFSMMLTRVGLMTERLHKSSKEMKAVNEVLNKNGIKLDFFDKAGKFAGVDNMVAQLDKLKDLSMEKRLQVLTRLFGEEGGRVADLIARNGRKGYQAALDTMDAEASLAQRISIATRSFRNQLEAFSGTFTNFLASVGAPLAQMFTPVLSTLNEIVGGPMMTFVEQNQGLVKVVGGIGAGAAGILAVGAAINALGFASTFAMGGVMRVVAWGSRLGTAVTWLTGLMPGLAAGFATVGAAIMATPVGWIAAGIAAVVAGGVLIYKYWEPLKAFFAGFGEGLVQGLAPIGQAFMGAFGPVWNVIQPLVMPVLQTIGSWLQSAWQWFTNLFTPIDQASKTTVAFGEAGKVCGEVVAGAFRIMLAPITAVLDAIKWINDNIGGVIEKAGQLGGQLGDKIGSGWRATKEFFGAKPAAPGAAPGAAPAGAPAGNQSAVQPGQTPALVPPAVPPMATARTQGAAPNINDNRQFTVNVHPAAGQDPRAIADEVERRQRASGPRRGGALYDYAMGY